MFSDNYAQSASCDARVRDGEECPECGEDREDRLVWNEYGDVMCANCGNVYNP